MVLTTHFLFNMNRGHVKLGFIVMIMKAIQAIKKKYGVEDVFFSGDFNLIPNSMLYNYIVNHKLNLKVDLKEYSN